MRLPQAELRVGAHPWGRTHEVPALATGSLSLPGPPAPSSGPACPLGQQPTRRPRNQHPVRHAAGRPSLQSRAGPQKEEDSNHKDNFKSQLCKGRADPHDISEVEATGQSLQRARAHPADVGLAQRLALWAPQTRPTSQPHCRAGAEVPAPHAPRVVAARVGVGGAAHGSAQPPPLTGSNILPSILQTRKRR